MITARDAQIFALNSVTTSIIAIQTVIPPSRVNIPINIHSPALPKLTRFQKFRQSAWAHNPWHNPACCCWWLSFWFWSFRKIQKHFSFFIWIYFTSHSPLFLRNASQITKPKKNNIFTDLKSHSFFHSFRFLTCHHYHQLLRQFSFRRFCCYTYCQSAAAAVGVMMSKKEKKTQFSQTEPWCCLDDIIHRVICLLRLYTQRPQFVWSLSLPPRWLERGELLRQVRSNRRRELACGPTDTSRFDSREERSSRAGRCKEMVIFVFVLKKM